LQTIALGAFQSVYTNLGEYQNVLDTVQKALEIDRKISLDREASAHSQIASAHSVFGDVRQALQFSHDALAKYKKVDLNQVKPNSRPSFWAGYLMTYRLLQSAYEQTGDFEMAQKYAQERVQLAIKSGFSVEIAKALSDLGKFYTSQNQLTLALNSAQEANRIINNVAGTENRKIQNDIKVQLIRIYTQQGNYSKASEIAQQQLNLARQNRNQELEIDLLDAIRTLQADQGNVAEEIKVLNQIVSLSRKLPSAARRFNKLLSPAYRYLTLGDYKSSKLLLQESLAEAQKTQVPQFTSGPLGQLALIELYQGNPKDAVLLAEKILVATSKGGLVHDITAYHILALGYGELGDKSKAIEMIQASLKISKKLQQPWSQKNALTTLASLHHKFGRSQEAISTYQTALAIPNRSDNAEIHTGLAKVYADLKKPAIATAFYKQAINGIEKYRQRLAGLSTDLKKSFLEARLGSLNIKTADIYRELANLLISQNRIGEAQEVLELLKIQELNDFTKSIRSATHLPKLGFSKTENDLIEQHGSLIGFSQKLAACDPIQCSQWQNFNKQYENLSAIWNQRIEEIQKKVTKAGAEIVSKKTSDIQANTAALVKSQPNSLVIYPVASDTQVNLIWAGTGGVSYTLPAEQLCSMGETKFFDKIKVFHDLLKTPTSDLKEIKAVGKELYDCLIKPLEPEIAENKIKHLIFIPDRATNYIPIGALFDGEKFLAERFSVSSSLSVEQTDTNPSPLKDLKNSNVLAFGVAKEISGFSALSHVKIELANIVKSSSSSEFGIYSGRKFLDDEFSRQTLEQNIQNYTVLHIATHGAFVPSDPAASYLLLGKASTFGEGSAPSFRYPIAQIASLRNLDRLHLVVLSACETAITSSDPNSGIVITGISSLFLGKNKAKAVIASLWKVDDASTSLQMQQFYLHLSQGKTKAQAIQQVQQDFINGKLTPKAAAALRSAMILTSTNPAPSTPRSTSSPDYTHPFYWAPFILIGNNL
jgi:CHAT domain-containing protein